MNKNIVYVDVTEFQNKDTSKWAATILINYITEYQEQVSIIYNSLN